ncbi:MAG: hypothetical protein RIC30_04230 [Marinoscillum sp.]|uniref:hypothetical protein n=1 Tax=Marinoscillum sp. TaxID=2024838 RepID=UPI003301C906
MKINKLLIATLALFALNIPAYSMDQMESGSFNMTLGLLELPFLMMAVVFSFLNARNLKGGKFGTGMIYLAWGFLVMAVGHLHMQVDYHFGFNLFNSVLGENGGLVAWFIALMLTWGLSGWGFYQIWKVSKS